VLQPLHCTEICPSTGRGRERASASTASRSARVSRRHGWTLRFAWARRHVPTISPATSTAPRPDSGGPQLGALRYVGDEELAPRSPVEEVCVAARQQAGGCRRSRRLAELRLVAGEDPAAADRRLHRRERLAQGSERRAGLAGSDPRPGAEPLRCRRPENVQVPAGELAARLLRLDLGPRHCPDRRCPRAVPAKQDGPRRRRVLDRVADAECLLQVVVLQPPPGEIGVHACRHVLGSLAAARSVGKSAQREDRAIAGRHDVHAVARPPELDERRILPARRMRALHARVDREESRSRNAVRQPGPARLPQRARPGREPLVERPGTPPEGEDLGARELERRLRHRRETIRRDRSRIAA
jgi:hypothetical protein